MISGISADQQVFWLSCSHAAAAAAAISRSWQPVPAAKRVESVHGRDPELLPRFGARRAGGDGAEAQALVVTETGLLHQLLHCGLLRRSQRATGRRLAIVWYWNRDAQAYVLFWGFYYSCSLFRPFHMIDGRRVVSLTWNVIVFMPRHSAASLILLQCALAATAHGDLSSSLCSFDNSFGERSERRRTQENNLMMPALGKEQKDFAPFPEEYKCWDMH